MWHLVLYVVIVAVSLYALFSFYKWRSYVYSANEKYHGRYLSTKQIVLPAALLVLCISTVLLMNQMSVLNMNNSDLPKVYMYDLSALQFNNSHCFLLNIDHSCNPWKCNKSFIISCRLRILWTNEGVSEFGFQSGARWFFCHAICLVIFAWTSKTNSCRECDKNSGDIEKLRWYFTYGLHEII